jgi:chloramphenicol 3-O-phosphotransferase
MTFGGGLLVVVGLAVIVVAAMPSLAEDEWRRTQQVKDRLPRWQRWVARLSKPSQRVYLAGTGAAVMALGLYAVFGLNPL